MSNTSQSTRDLQRLYQLVDAVDELHSLLESRVVTEFRDYLVKRIEDIQRQRVDWLREERKRVLQGRAALGESIVDSLLEALDREIDLLMALPIKREHLLGERDPIDEIAILDSNIFEFGFTISRRKPVILMVDNSRGVADNTIWQINDIIKQLFDDLLNSPEAYDLCYLAVISLAYPASLVVPLVHIEGYSPTSFERIDREPDLASAFGVLHDLMSSYHSPYDYKTDVLLLTSGNFLDSSNDILTAKSKSQGINLSVFACGENPNLPVLRELSSNTILASDIGPDYFKELLKFVSQSVATVTRAMDKEAGTLPPEPSGWDIIL